MDTSGYWGAVTSSVDWCEINYEHSPFIAEFFNTFSSLAMVIVGGVGAWLHRTVLEARFILALLIVVVVGIGSIAFHATLRFEHQMLDELPMLYSALVMLYILVENRAQRRFGMWFPAALVVWAAIVTALSSQTRGPAQFWAFQLSFTPLEFFALYRVYRLQRVSSVPSVRRVFRTGMACYLTAMTLWFVDFRACGFLQSLPAYGIPNPQFHAFWHLFVSFGLYLLVIVIAAERVRVLGQPFVIHYKWGFVPHLKEPRDLSHGVLQRSGQLLGRASNSTR